MQRGQRRPCSAAARAFPCRTSICRCPPSAKRIAATSSFGIEKGIDLIAASFVCRPSDVADPSASSAPITGGSHVQIFSKIENRMGVNNFDEILKVSDGIMVARGDLGVEVDMEEVPVLQKQFIHKCNVARQAGHHRDADARFHDPQPAPRPARRPATWRTPSSTARTRSCSPARRPRANTRLRPSARWCASPTYIEAHQLHDNTQLLQQEAVRNATVRTVANAVSLFLLPDGARPQRERDHHPEQLPARRRAWLPASARIARSSPRPRASTHTNQLGPELRRCARAHGRERRHGRAHQTPPSKRRSRAGWSRPATWSSSPRACRPAFPARPTSSRRTSSATCSCAARRGQRLRERQRLHRQHAQRFGERL